MAAAVEAAVPRLALHGIVKRYDGRAVVADVDFACASGEVVGLVGHNGAGKSTLSKIVAGLERPDEGTLELDGRRHDLRSAEDAIKAGIGLVPQRLAVVPTLTVRENIQLGSRLRRGEGAGAEDSIDAVAASLDIAGQLDDRAELLRPAGQRLLMIARALVRSPRLLILDEPTSAFSTAEVDRLFGIVDDLRRERGIGVVYVSHRLEEVLSLVDRVVALSQGRVIADRSVTGLDKGALADLMAGRHVENVTQHATSSRAERQPSDGKVVLRCRELDVGRKLSDLNFEVRAGEVVGLTGLVGSGRTTLLNGLCGTADIPLIGKVEVSGKEYRPRGMRKAISRRIAYLPEHRAQNSIFPRMTVRENVTLPTVRRDRSRFWPMLSRGHESDRVDGALAKLDVKPDNASEMPMTLLSGGNQQKSLLARWLLVDLDLFIMDEPTEGVDVHGRESIYALIRELTAKGVGVLLSSSDIEEVVSCCDRVLVLRSGGIGAELQREEMTVERVSRVCLG